MTEKDFLQALKDIENYWLSIPKDRLLLEEGETEIEYRMNGMIFSMLVMFDGDNSLNDFRPISLVSNGKVINNSGRELHDMWYQVK